MRRMTCRSHILMAGWVLALPPVLAADKLDAFFIEDRILEKTAKGVVSDAERWRSAECEPVVASSLSHW